MTASRGCHPENSEESYLNTVILSATEGSRHLTGLDSKRITPVLHHSDFLESAIRRRYVDGGNMLLVSVEVGKPHGDAL